jgi:hypothetical protein
MASGSRKPIPLTPHFQGMNLEPKAGLEPATC